jgi:hypothetical protein
VALLVALAQVATIALVAAGKLPGPSRNVVFQALLGGGIVYVMLGGYLLAHHAPGLRRPPVTLAVFFLLVFALLLTGLQFRSLRPLLGLEYDIAAWSEPMFVLDIIKWRTGAALYLPADDSNSNVYNFGAPALTYFLAWVSGNAASVVAYRWIQMLYLAVAALFTALSAQELLRLGTPERFVHASRLWLPFFFFSALLFCVNPQTCAFNVFLHNDPLTMTVSAAAFYVLLRYARERRMGWLAAMAVLPAAGFFVKQYLAIWAAAYVTYLLLEEPLEWRRVIGFGATAFGLVGISVGAGFLLWGENYRYWIFTIMGGHLISVEKLMGRFSDAAVFLLPGLVAAYYFLRGEAFRKFLGIACGWVILILGALYTSGITYSPTHLGPASLAGLCLALAALAGAWSAREETASSEAHWLRVLAGAACVVLLFGGFGLLWPNQYPLTDDFHRYIGDIEREFAGHPAEQVLLDSGDWIYLRANVLPKDRMAILVTHQTPHYGMLGRIERREYARVLARVLPDGRLSYDLAWDRGIGEALHKHYREVRRIAPYERKRDWRYGDSFLSEVVVFEPTR